MNDSNLLQFLSEIAPGTLHFGQARMALLEIEGGFGGIRRQLDAFIGPRLAGLVLQQAGANGGGAFAAAFQQANSAMGKRELFESCVQAYQSAGFGQFEIREAHWPLGQVVIRAQDAFEAWMMRQHGQQVDHPICDYTAGVLVGFINAISGRRDVVCIEHRCQACGDQFCEFQLVPVTESHGRPVVALTPDPALGRQINLLELLFDRMPMGIAVLDRQYRIQRYNPTWEEFSERYAPPSGAPLVPGVCYFDHLPGTEPTVRPLFQRALAGETIRRNGIRLESEGIVTYWDVVLAPLIEDGRIVGILSVTVDATERVEAQQHLEQRVEERTREVERRRQVAESLRDTLSKINSSDSLDEVLDFIVAQADQLSATAFVALYVLTDEQGPLQVQALRGQFPEEMRQVKLKPGEGTVGRAVADRRILAIPDVDQIGYAPSPEEIDESRPVHVGQANWKALQRAAGAFKAVLAIPLLTQNAVYGALTFYYPKPHRFQPEEVQLASAFADQAALAIENALLRGQAAEIAKLAERSRLARDLHDAVTQTLFSASLIADVLPTLWERSPDAGREKLDELRLLTRGALSEMRTLLLELRPDTLREVDLGDLYRHLANAFSGRTRVPVDFTQQSQARLPPQVKEAFYRVAQEALNNIAKHANATEVQLHLNVQPDWAEVTICDNGTGFETTRLTPENLGLKIMRERAEAIHADLAIESAPGAGTTIGMYWQAEEESSP